VVTKKKKKPPMSLVDVFGKLPGAMRVVTDEPSTIVDSDQKYLRYAAGIYYTTDLRGCSLVDMTKHPIYGVVPLRTLERWCGLDDWTKRRAAVLEQWRKKIEAAVGSKLAQSRVHQLESLQRVYDKVLLKLETDAVEAGTYEGMTSVLLRLAELMDEWRARLAQEIWPAMAEASAGDGRSTALMVRPKLSREEAREAAMLIIQRRREELKAEREANPEPEG